MNNCQDLRGGTSAVCPPLLPRDGETLRVAILCRSSASDHQKQMQCNHAQEVRIRAHLERIWHGPAEVTVITGTGCGHAEFAEAFEAIATGRFDVALAADLTRISRGPDALAFCRLAAENGTRVMTPAGEVELA